MPEMQVRASLGFLNFGHKNIDGIKVANNRFFLVNKHTKKFICIAKHLGGPWYKSPVIDKLEDFLECEDNSESFWNEEHCYELLYEDQLTSEHTNFIK